MLPIPPGTHWSDAKPLVLPGVPSANESAAALPGPKAPRVKKEKAAEAPAPIKRNGLSFDIPQQGEALPEAKAEKPKKEPKPQVKNDPQLVAAARELKDRWLEQVNAGLYLPVENGKYDVRRLVDETVGIEDGPRLLAA